MSYEPCHWLKWNKTLLSNWLCQSVWGYFWKAPQYHYYSVWNVIYFSQNPLNLKSKKLSFQKAKFCPLVYGYINSPFFICIVSDKVHAARSHGMWISNSTSHVYNTWIKVWHIKRCLGWDFIEYQIL